MQRDHWAQKMAEKLEKFSKLLFVGALHIDDCEDRCSN
jgi:hypothetical protein